MEDPAQKTNYGISGSSQTGSAPTQTPMSGGDSHVAPTPSGQRVKEQSGQASPSVKEREPFNGTLQLEQAPHERTIAIPEEVAEYVKISPETEKPKIPSQVREMGVKEAGESVPIPTSPSVAFPTHYSEEQVSKASAYPVWSSIRFRLTQWGREMKRKARLLLQGGNI